MRPLPPRTTRSDPRCPYTSPCRSTREKSRVRDHATTTVYDFAPLGLVEMTRKRTGESLQRQLSQLCHECGCRGMLKTAETVTYEIFRETVRPERQFEAERLLVID